MFAYKCTPLVDVKVVRRFLLNKTQFVEQINVNCFVIAIKNTDHYTIGSRSCESPDMTYPSLFLTIFNALKSIALFVEYFERYLSTPSVNAS